MPVKNIHKKLPIRSNQKTAEAIMETDLQLLQMCAEDLVPALKADPDLRHVRQMAFEAYDKERDEKIQVHVLVTRDEDDFLEVFQTEEMS